MRVFHFTRSASWQVVSILLLAGAFAAQGAWAQQAGTAKSNPPETEKAESNNVFRHTPLVQSISKAVFHDADAAPEVREQHVETTARIFEYVNFAIIFFGIVIPIGRVMPKLLHKRSHTLKQDLESARKATAEAKDRLSAVEAQLASLDKEIAAMRAQVEQDAKSEEARIKSAIQEESARIVTTTEQEVASAVAQARRGLRTFAADLAIEHAARQLVLTPETDRALIAEFVGETGKGGSN